MSVRAAASASVRLPPPSPRLAAPAQASARPASTHAVRDGFDAGRQDGLLTYRELSAGQRSLLGPQGASTYSRLSTEQRAVFLLLTRRMERAGADFSGLRLQDPVNTLRPNRMLFAPDAAGQARLKASLEAGVARGTFQEAPVFAPFHEGMSDWGVRENRGKWAMQLGMGPDGAFVDVDHYNPKKGLFEAVGHLGEILVPGKPSALTIAKELGENLHTRQPTAARLAAS